MTGTLFVISAPSGTGKTTLVKKLVDTTPNLLVSISYTTRAQRSNEIDGVNYFFVTPDKFHAMAEQGCFLEHASIYGNYYGTAQSWVEKQLALGQDIVLEIDWQGGEQIRRMLPDAAVGIFIVPPSKHILRGRLEHRNQDDQAGITRRLSHTQEEVSHCSEYDYLVINDNFDQALADLQAIVRAKRLSISQQMSQYRDLLVELMA